MQKLPKTRFNLRVPKAKSETQIFLVFRYNGLKLLYYTGLRIHPKDWDTKTQRPIERKHNKEFLLLHEKIETIAKRCKDIYINSNYGDITVKKFKEKLSTTEYETPTKKTSIPKPTRVEFLDFLEIGLSEMEDTGAKKDSIRNFRIHANLLKQFADEKGKFTYEDIDWNLRLKLIDWLTKRNTQISYGNKTLKILRMFSERARRKGLHTNVNYQGRGWAVPETKARGHKVYFNQEELQTLADLQLSGIKNKVRDLFLIGAGTGQRFSDYSKYVPEDFYTSLQGIPLLSVISKKTYIPAKIPLNIFPWLLPILEKYNYVSPQVSMQKTNLWIKELCKDIGSTNKVMKIEQYMGRKARVVKSYVPKWEEIGTHTARRSFATNLYRMGYHTSQIMPMTGHATESQLREYIGIDGEENAESIGLDMLRLKKA